GYSGIQGTKPQTLAYALNDSAVGLAAWIVEKFHTWTDNAGDLESVVTRDELLTNIMLYWVSGAIGSSFWPYYARQHEGWPLPGPRSVDVPHGLLRLSKGHPASTALVSRARLQQHPALDAAAQRRALRGSGGAASPGRRYPNLLSTTALGFGRRCQSV